MKTKTTVLFIILTFTILFSANATAILPSTAQEIARKHLQIYHKADNYSVRELQTFGSGDTIDFYVAHLSPVGFIMVSGDERVHPVIGYSFTNNFGESEMIARFFKETIRFMVNNASLLSPKYLYDVEQSRKLYLNDKSLGNRDFQQWPQEGTTLNGGLLSTQWTQTAPFNLLCPLDNGSRSYAGCPAVAMAQIMNYYRTTNQIVFGDSDDYYHNYTNQFTIDDDYQTWGFPSFPELNTYLDTLNVHWQNNVTLTDTDKAALIFACGTVCNQVYSNQGSGTFGVYQAIAGYERFGCENAELFYSSTALLPAMVANIQNAHPVHYAVVDINNTYGHNVVVDGYNTDHYFHVNFGYAGQYDGWYLLPEEMPMGLTVLEGAICNIMTPGTKIPDINKPENALKIYPNPTSDIITIEYENILNEAAFIKIIDIKGEVVYQTEINTPSISFNADTIGMPGLYFASLKFKSGKNIGVKKFILQ